MNMNINPNKIIQDEISPAKALYKRLTTPIPDIKCGKNVTQLDINALKTYIQARTFKLGTTVEEGRQLFKREGTDFINNIMEFMYKKLNITPEVAPVVQTVSKDVKVPFSYTFANNSIQIPENITEYNKETIFNALRHELRHYEQNMIMLRHQDIGPSLIKDYAEYKFNALIIGIKIQLKDPEFVKNIKNLSEEDQMLCNKCIEFLKNNDEKGMAEYLAPYKDIYKQEWESLRETICKHYGKLTPKEEKLAKLYYQDASNIQYYNPDGSIDIVKHSLTGLEQEANMAGEYAVFEAKNGGCYMHLIKNVTKDFFTSENPNIKQLSDKIAISIDKRS